MIELKPCPFCGSEVESRAVRMCLGEKTIGLEVKCKCGAKVDIGSQSWRVNGVRGLNEEDAAEKWNRRAGEEPEQKSVIDIMDEVMEDICEKYCKYPNYLSEEELNAKCDECPFERLG